MGTNDMRYVNCTHTHMHSQNSQLNTLVWGSLTLDQLCRVLYRGEPGKSLPPPQIHDVGGQTGVVPSNRVIPGWGPVSLYMYVDELTSARVRNYSNFLCVVREQYCPRP